MAVGRSVGRSVSQLGWIDTGREDSWRGLAGGRWGVNARRIPNRSLTQAATALRQRQHTRSGPVFGCWCYCLLFFDELFMCTASTLQRRRYLAIISIKPIFLPADSRPRCNSGLQSWCRPSFAPVRAFCADVRQYFSSKTFYHRHWTTPFKHTLHTAQCMNWILGSGYIWKTFWPLFLVA